MSQPILPEPLPASPDPASGIFSPLTKLNLLILCVFALIYAGLMLTEFMPAIIVMLACSLILTYLLLGPVTGIENLLFKLLSKRWKASQGLCKALAIILVYLVFFGLIAFSILRIALPLSIQLKEFAKEIPNYISKVNPSASATSSIQGTGPLLRETLQTRNRERFGDAEIIRQEQITIVQPKPPRNKSRLLSATVTLAMQKIAIISKSYAAKLGGYILDIGTTTLSGLIYTLTTLVLVFYLLYDGKTLQKGMVELLPTRHEVFAEAFLNRLHNQFYTIVKGQVLMSFLSGGLLYCLLLVMGIKYALLLGVVYGAASILPVIGPWLGLIPIIVIVELRGNPINILPVLLTAGLFYLTKAYWLWPKLISKKFDIHPLLFLLTFLACIKVVGFLGVFLSFPFTSILGVWVDFQKARSNSNNAVGMGLAGEGI